MKLSQYITEICKQICWQLNKGIVSGATLIWTYGNKLRSTHYTVFLYIRAVTIQIKVLKVDSDTIFKENPVSEVTNHAVFSFFSYKLNGEMLI